MKAGHRFAVACLCLLGGGCGPRVGDEYQSNGIVAIYVNENRFKEAAELVAAGLNPDGGKGVFDRDLKENRVEYAGRMSRFKIIHPVEGGAKIQVTGGDKSGVTGCGF